MGHRIKYYRIHLAKESIMQSNVPTKHNRLYVAILIIVDNSDNTWYLDINVTNDMTHHNESFVPYPSVGERPICIFGG
jgi:hypothetical protein